MANIGPMEVIVVLIIALVVLGPRRLPGVGKSLGRGMREFRSSISGHDDDEISFPHTETTEPTRHAVAATTSTPVATAANEPVREREIV